MRNRRSTISVEKEVVAWKKCFCINERITVEIATLKEAVAKLDKKDYALMVAMYLLTANCRLWSCTGRYVQRNEILFEKICLKCSTANGYTLYCAAKDLYLGTKNLTIGDLADTTIIELTIFGVICNAMAIRRYGLGAVNFKERTDKA